MLFDEITNEPEFLGEAFPILAISTHYARQQFFTTNLQIVLKNKNIVTSLKPPKKT